MSQQLVVVKRGGAPIVDIIPRKYRLIDATEIDQSEEEAEFNNPFKWDFYLQKGAIKVPPRMRIRVQYNEYDAQYIYYLCRYGDMRKGKSVTEKNSKEHLSVMQINLYEAEKLANVLGEFLNSFESHPKTGEGSNELISYFRGREARAYEWQDNDMIKFFESPDARISDNFMVRFGHNKETKRYTAFLFNVVPASRRLENWLGPTYYAGMGAIGTLVYYFRKTLREILGGEQDGVLSLPPPPPPPAAAQDDAEENA